MSTLLRPTGPRPAGVYWWRRLLVLLVVLALALGVRWLLTGRSADGTPVSAPTDSPSASPTTSPTRTPSPTASTTKKPSKSPSATRSASSSPSATATGTPACTDSQITVTASTDAASYPVGSTPRLRMKIENTSSTACKRDIGAAQNELIITSGTAHVWSSDDCNPGGTPQVETIAPGQSFSVSVTWLGRLSQPGCPANEPAAKAGNYKLVGRNGKVLSDPAVFSLT